MVVIVVIIVPLTEPFWILSKSPALIIVPRVQTLDPKLCTTLYPKPYNSYISLMRSVPRGRTLLGRHIGCRVYGPGGYRLPKGSPEGCIIATVRVTTRAL